MEEAKEHLEPERGRSMGDTLPLVRLLPLPVFLSLWSSRTLSRDRFRQGCCSLSDVPFETKLFDCLSVIDTESELALDIVSGEKFSDANRDDEYDEKCMINAISHFKVLAHAQPILLLYLGIRLRYTISIITHLFKKKHEAEPLSFCPPLSGVRILS